MTRQRLWRPYTQMMTANPPLEAARTEGSAIHLADGRVLIDGIASWWTACHGYNHPHIREAVTRQLEVMPHVMFGGFTHEPAERLAARLRTCCRETEPRLLHRFRIGGGRGGDEDGGAILAQPRGSGSPPFSSVSAGAYHGDTSARCRSATPRPACTPIRRLAAAGSFLPIFRATPRARRRWMRFSLNEVADEIAAIITEPLVQGAGGMLFHDAETLRAHRAHRQNPITRC